MTSTHPPAAPLGPLALLLALLAFLWRDLAAGAELLRCWLLVLGDLAAYGLSVLWERLRGR